MTQGEGVHIWIERHKYGYSLPSIQLADTEGSYRDQMEAHLEEQYGKESVLSRYLQEKGQKIQPIRNQTETQAFIVPGLKVEDLTGNQTPHS